MKTTKLLLVINLMYRLFNFLVLVLTNGRYKGPIACQKMIIITKHAEFLYCIFLTSVKYEDKLI